MKLVPDPPPDVRVQVLVAATFVSSNTSQPHAVCVDPLWNLQAINWNSVPLLFRNFMSTTILINTYIPFCISLLYFLLDCILRARQFLAAMYISASAMPSIKGECHA